MGIFIYKASSPRRPNATEPTQEDTDVSVGTDDFTRTASLLMAA